MSALGTPPDEHGCGVVARSAANMSQLELAGKVGKSRPQIANIEGGRASFDVKMLSSFAKALGVPAKELIP